MALRIAVHVGFSEVFTFDTESAVELGRQRDGDDAPFSFDGRRLVIASAEEVSISRSQLQIEPLDEQHVTLRNASRTTQLDITNSGERLNPEETRVVELPVVCQVGSRTIRIESTETSIHTLGHVTQLPGSATARPVLLPVRRLSDLAHDLPRFQPVIRTLQQVVDMLQYADSAEELYRQACAAAVELLGLEQAQVFLREEQGWRSQATGATTAATIDLTDIRGSDTVTIRETVPRSMVGRLRTDLDESLDYVLRQKQVMFEFKDSTHIARTQVPEAFVVAAPLLNRAGEVIGVLCAKQSLDDRDTNHVQLAKLQSQLLELIACAVSSALLRLEQEQQRKSLQRQFDQFFSKTLSRHLERQPDLLEGRDAEVSLLFCDIRNFTRHSEHLAAADIFAWINDVMETLSQCVMKYDGVLVDYIGDELIAMWGAPEEQPDHALRACRAAIDMLQQVPQLNRRWAETLRTPLRLGIGINTGPVRVGNTGSQQKFKYGPLGPTVNVASRIQGATKYVDCPVLVSESTFQQIQSQLRTRPICPVRLVNVDQPITLHELAEAADRNETVCQEYGRALELFMQQELQAASCLLGSILQRYPEDGPSRILLKRTLEYLIDDNLAFDAAWLLPGK